ncbi:hypothetical protein L1887_16655 [Cichorium endivia]|nr:hypothetical protein L1887_16655 [Cichorium endivia]
MVQYYNCVVRYLDNEHKHLFEQHTMFISFSSGAPINNLLESHEHHETTKLNLQSSRCSALHGVSHRKLSNHHYRRNLSTAIKAPSPETSLPQSPSSSLTNPSSPPPPNSPPASVVTPPVVVTPAHPQEFSPPSPVQVSPGPTNSS